MICPPFPTYRHLALRLSTPQPFRTFTSSSARKMPVADPNALNASGLSASESQKLKERSPEAHEEKILQAIKEVRAPHAY